MKSNPLKEQFNNRKVFITGHTGFKGSWLTLWLNELGAKVIGYSLPPEKSPNLFDLAKIDEDITHIEGDIRDYALLKSSIDVHQPDIVFHLAAQAIVFNGYSAPKETFDINSSGTVNVLEAIRTSSSVKAAVIVTTDKCYENKNWLWGYKESDHLGGHDPYSASKSMAELAVSAYRSAFFENGNPLAPKVASARAGNIIGGGDFSDFRIVPDCMKALLEEKNIQVRNPSSTRPWLYVLDALYGYLLLGANLLSGNSNKAEAWNFGPLENKGITVKEIVEESIRLFGKGSWDDVSQGQQAPKEMALLRLNWDKAAHSLGWNPALCWKGALAETASWYKSYGELTEGDRKKSAKDLCKRHISDFEKLKRTQ